MLKRIGLIGLLLLTCVGFIHNPNTVAEATPVYAQGAFFIENVGQYAPEIRFQGMTDLGPMLLTTDSLWLIGAHDTSTTLPSGGVDTVMATSVPVQLRFRNANPAVTLEPVDRLATPVHYLLGSDEAAWHRNVPTWAGVRYRNLYPGIDLEMVSDAHGQLRRTLVAHPGADLTDVALEVVGADAVDLTNEGIAVSTAAGPVTIPLLTLISQGRQLTTAALPPRLEGTTVYQPFVQAAPTANPGQTDDFVYYYPFGGSNAEWISALEIITQTGTLYFTGQTFSTNLPTFAAVYPAFQGGQTDGYLGRLSANGALEFLTYYGGSGRDYTYDLEFDKNGRILLTGYTNSPNFPTSSLAMDKAIDPATCNFSGSTETCYDAFVSRVSGDGQSILESTYLGGNNHDYGYAIIDDKSSGEVFIAGRTASTNFPTHQTAYDRNLGGVHDVFVTKLNTGLSSLIHSTYYGGGNDEIVLDIAILQDTAQVYITGQTLSNNLPVHLGFDMDYSGGGDVYVARFSAPLDTLQYGSYLGGTGFDDSNRILVSPLGKAVIVGTTDSADFPIVGQAIDATFNGSRDAFYTVVNTAGNALEYSTYWGGNGADNVYGVNWDAEGTIVIGGETTSTNLRTSLNAQSRTRIATQMGFVVKFNPLQSNKLYYSSYIGKDPNTAFSSIFDIGIGDSGYVYIGGYTGSQALAAKLNVDKDMLLMPMIRKPQ